MLIRIILTYLIIISWHATAASQEIDFKRYANYNLSVSEPSSEGLNFGDVVKNNGTYTVDINNSKIVSITGAKYLDVTVEISAEDYLYLNGNTAHAGDAQKTIPLTLEAAYANNAGTPTISNAKFLNVTGNYALVQFPILERQSLPPGPPPPPPTEGMDQSLIEETAHLYLYGSINVGNVDAGSYESTITLTINYY